MKQKYKLDQMIQFKTGHGVVTGVISRKEGFFYETTGSDSTIPETDVVAAFKPIAQRKARRRKLKDVNATGSEGAAC